MNILLSAGAPNPCILLVDTDSQGHATLVTIGSSLKLVCADSCGVVDSNTLREQVNTALPVTALWEQ